MPETQTTRRLHWLLWILLTWVGAIFVRLVWLQVIQHDDLLRAAQQQQQRYVEVPALRGAILDRSGQPLAKSLPSESICVNPQKIPDPEVAADLLSRVLDLNRPKLLGKIQEACLRHSGFLWIKRKVSAEEAARVRSLKLDWVEFRPELRRFYPHGTLAAHVLGSVGMVSEDSVERGTAGIEASFEDDLAGTPGRARVFTDVKQNPYDSVIAREPDPGANLTLTIDPNLQYDAEKELAKAIEASGAKTGSVVALNPTTGDILAMANYPSYDPNQTPGPGEQEGARSNLAITTPFEPGSVFKVITLSAALETTNLTPDTIINCGNGTIKLFGRVIHDHNSYSALSMADVLAKSSNIGAIQIGLKVGDRKLYNYVRKFGFGRKTGIELPGESPGMLRRVEQWEPSSIGSVAMGHEVGATSIQLALAGAVIANGGLLVKPRLVLARQKPGEAEERYAPERPTRVIAPETAIKMRRMMEGVVLHGTGKGHANLIGYTSGGKTGSAQIYDFKAHAYTHHYNASFLGFAPVANPQIVIAVTLVGTSGGGAGYGGPVAGPVFRGVATSALRMLDVPKDLPDSLLRVTRAEPADDNDLAIAGLSGPPLESPAAEAAPAGPLVAHNADAVRSHSETAHNADAAGSNLAIAHNADAVRSRSVSSVTPPPVLADSPAPAGESAEDRRPFLAGPKVPDFHGMTQRAVFEESAARGLKLEVLGNGLARTQDPPPGAVLPAGARVRVQFAR
jgi:cell division protein FtsI (penicillin-binding protein 3)